MSDNKMTYTPDKPIDVFLNSFGAVALALIVLCIGVSVAHCQNPPAPNSTVLLSAPPPPAPTTLSAFQSSGPSGNGIVYYWVVARFSAGNSPVTGPTVVPQTNGPSAAVNITAAWSSVPGAVSYDLLRTTTPSIPSGSCTCLVASATTAVSFVDAGTTATAYTITTGSGVNFWLSLNNTAGTGPFIQSLLGSTSGFLPVVGSSALPLAGNCAVWSANAQLLDSGATCGGGGGGGGDVNGPASAVADHVAVFNGTTGKLIKDGGVLPTGDVAGPGSATNNAIALYSGTTGKIIKDSAVLLPTGLLVGTGQANTYTTGLQSFSSARAVMPQSGFFAPALTAEFGWNASIARVVVGNTLATSQTLAVQGTASPTANDCVKFDASGFLVTAGGPCSTGGSVSAASPYLTIGSSLYGPIFTVTNPATPAWAWNNQNLATLTTTNNAQTLCAPPSGLSVNSRLISTPGTPWTLTAQFIFNVVNASLPRMGVALHESGTGKIITSGPTTTTEFYAENWNSSTSFSGVAATVNLGASAGFKFMRVVNNGTNISIAYSYDGIGWHVYYDFSKTNWFTTGPDQFGFFIMNNSAALNVCSTLISWSVT